jgi:hypothetical protein
MGALLTNAFGAISGAVVIGWVIWIFITSSPAERLDRTCAPVGVVQKIATSMVMLMDGSERNVAATKAGFERTVYGCKFTVWRVFYEDSWKAEMAEQERQRQEDEAAARRMKDATPRPSK